MAIYCANCGTQIKTGGKFCQACGTAVQQPWQPTEAPTFQQPMMSAQAMVTPPPRRSNNFMKIALIVCSVIVALTLISIIGAALFIRQAVKQVKINEDGGKTEVSIGGMKLSAENKVTEEQLGVPIYPGAKAAAGTGSFSFSTNNGKSAFVGGATFTTEDSVEKVAEFYKDKLGNAAEVAQTISNNNHSVVLQAKTESGFKNIVISNDGSGATKIVISNIGKGLR